MMTKLDEKIYTKLMELSFEVFSNYEFLLREYAEGEATKEDKCNLKLLAEILNRNVEKDSKMFKEAGFYECLTWTKILNDLK